MRKYSRCQETKQVKPRAGQFSYYLENPKTEYLFTGTDERGKTVYFFKMNITGLYDRVFGPYDTRAIAVDCFDNVLDCGTGILPPIASTR